MVAKAMEVIATAFSACVQWTDTLLDRTGGKGFVIAAIIIVFITSLFLMPLRGGHVALNGAIVDYAGNSIHHPGRYAKGYSVGSRRKVGKFERGNSSARLARNARMKK